MSSLIFWIVVGLIVWAIVRSSGDRKNISVPTDINQQWMDYLASVNKTVKKPAERALLEKMIADLQKQGMPPPSEIYSDIKENTEAIAKQQSTSVATASVSNDESAVITASSAENNFLENKATLDSSTSKNLDNESILLYFGAFLFVAAAGLFVGFGTASGSVRLAVILIVMSLLYWSGLWLFDSKPKLKLAGLTFVGIGLMLAPLAGVAAYSFIFRGHPEAVWLATSVLCLGLYGHALSRLRNPLLEYIFIGTFLSLFESLISVLHAPIYYYGWMLAGVGLMLQAFSMWRHWQPSLDKPTSTSSLLLVPLSLFVAILLTPSYGALQFAISALLAGIYYLLAYYQTTDNIRDNFAVASQLAFLTSASNFAFAYQHQFKHVAIVLIFLSLVQVWAGYVRPVSPVLKNMATTMLLSCIIAIVAAWESASLMLVASLWLVCASGAVWLRQNRPDAYVVGVLGAVAAPFIYGYGVVQPHLAVGSVAWLLFVVLGLQIVVHFTLGKRSSSMPDWNSNFSAAYLISLVATVVTAMVAESTQSIIVCVVSAVATSLLIQKNERNSWSLISGLIIAAPMLVLWSDSNLFFMSTAVALLWNIALALRYRFEENRWIGTALWLLLPVAIAHNWPTQLGSASYYAWSYVVICLGFLLARAIAIGRLVQSVKVPVVSYLRTASVSYVTGYLVAGAIALCASLFGPRFLPAYIALLLAAITYFASTKLEKEPGGMAYLPVILQFGLWGTYETSTGSLVYGMISTSLAILGYIIATLGFQASNQYALNLKQASLVLAYLTPLSSALLPVSWIMPVALFAAGTLTLHAVMKSEQSHRELAGGVMILSVLWWMSYLGVENTQAYTHVIAAFLGLYAYLRAKRHESAISHQYIVAMLVVSSVPLALQAMSGEGGGVYGWWFLAEQILIMLLGMTIRDKFVIKWGLYAAVLAVLYQLRSLGWAALSFLAVFIIAMAVYRLQKNDQTDKSEK